MIQNSEYILIQNRKRQKAKPQKYKNNPQQNNIYFEPQYQQTIKNKLGASNPNNIIPPISTLPRGIPNFYRQSPYQSINTQRGIYDKLQIRKSFNDQFQKNINQQSNYHTQMPRIVSFQNKGKKYTESNENSGFRNKSTIFLREKLKPIQSSDIRNKYDNKDDYSRAINGLRLGRQSQVYESMKLKMIQRQIQKQRQIQRQRQILKNKKKEIEQRFEEQILRQKQRQRQKQRKIKKQLQNDRKQIEIQKQILKIKQQNINNYLQKQKYRILLEFQIKNMQFNKSHIKNTSQLTIKNLPIQSNQKNTQTVHTQNPFNYTKFTTRNTFKQKNIVDTPKLQQIHTQNENLHQQNQIIQSKKQIFTILQQPSQKTKSVKQQNSQISYQNTQQKIINQSNYLSILNQSQTQKQQQHQQFNNLSVNITNVEHSIIGNLDQLNKLSSIFPKLPQNLDPQISNQQLSKLVKQIFKAFNVKILNDSLINMKKFKNCVYFNYNQQHILWHYNGKLYLGGWVIVNQAQQGYKSGSGIQFSPKKYIYQGQFKKGKRTGFGIMCYFNGDSYIGSWSQGLRHGKGKMQEVTGIVYQGQWKNGKKHGYGKLILSTNQVYQGMFDSGLKHGFGKQIFKNGDSYKGQYIEGLFSGEGIYRWADGSIYHGQFVCGKRNGKGKWRENEFKQGDCYEGEFLRNKKQGLGKFIWKNKSVYQGYFKNDLKHGQGILKYEDGKLIKGIWDRDILMKQLYVNNSKIDVSQNSNQKSSRGKNSISNQ